MNGYEVSISTRGKSTRLNQDRASVDDLIVTSGDPAAVSTAFLRDEGIHAACVCDGVTSSADGGAAAQEVCMAIRDAYAGKKLKTSQDVLDGIIARAAAKLNYETDGVSATTVAVALFDDSFVYSYNLGDSPVFLKRAGGEMIPIYEEHTLAREKAVKGVPEDAGDRDTITQGMATDLYEYRGFYIKTPWREGDTVIIASDGLTKALKEDEIASMECDAASLVEAAASRDDSDDITVVTVRNSWREIRSEQATMVRITAHMDDGEGRVRCCSDDSPIFDSDGKRFSFTTVNGILGHVSRYMIETACGWADIIIGDSFKGETEGGLVIEGYDDTGTFIPWRGAVLKVMSVDSQEPLMSLEFM